MTTYTTQNIDAFTAATALSASDKFAVAQGDVVMRRALISQLVTFFTSGGGLGLGTMAYENSNAVTITGGTITGITDLAVADGGTGSSTAAGARTNLGLGSISTQDASNVTITGGSITGITDLAVADGGTGASTASAARTNLGLGTIATQDAATVTITGGTITGITDLAVADGGTGASTASGARTNLGLGTISTQNSSTVTITGGTITGITDLAVADGGTGASTAQLAAQNLGVPYLLGTSAVAIPTPADTTEDLLASIAIPANAMGANGYLIIETLWSYTSSANTKTPRVRLHTSAAVGGTVFTQPSPTANSGGHLLTGIWNRNATNSQVGGITIGSISSAGATAVTSAIDTTSICYVVFTGQKASSGETLTLEAYSVRLQYAA